jgi:hypothetical protein
MSDDKPTDQKSFDEILENSPDPGPRAALLRVRRPSLAGFSTGLVTELLRARA